MYDVSVTKCDSYNSDEVKKALSEALEAIGGLDWVKAGMKIAIKANLVSFMTPDKAATTHPALLCELVKMLVEKGADVVVGDSPGGIYNYVYVNKVYKATGMYDVEKVGGRLNRDFGQTEVKNPNGKVLKSFIYTSWLDEADAIINFCKLKTHGMMGMSAAAKNIFGVIPGTLKPEYHFRFPNHDDFARMMVDLDEFFKVRLCICDAVVGMEGNGPTMGTPRKIGAVIASESPHKIDLVCAKIIGLTKADVPTLEAAFERGFIPADVKELNVFGNVDSFVVDDFKNIPAHTSVEFKKDSTKFFGKMAGFITGKALRSVPALKASECVGCGVCRDICPAKAIKIEKGKAVIDRKLCIRCFCCQEFCPKGAMKVRRTLIARILNK